MKSELLNTWNKKNNDLTEVHVNTILSELHNQWFDEKLVSKKIMELMNATTLNAKWDVMNDNAVQLQALKLVMSMLGIKTTSNTPQVNINLFWKQADNKTLEY